jgi:formylglycine-generating enzyme required for sulfatase activity
MPSPIEIILKGFRLVVSPVCRLALLAGFAASVPAQEVSIPDPNFNAVIREALQKPSGPLTQSDMLSLTNISAIFRNITNVQGLETAANLVSLDLQDNRITNINFPTNLTRLVSLDLSENPFLQLALPSGMTNLQTLRLENGRLTNLRLSAGLIRLTSLRVGFNQLSGLVLPADTVNLTELSAYQNQLTDVTFPPRMSRLTILNLDGNQLDTLHLPTGLTNLNFIALGGNKLTSFTVAPDMTNLTALRLNDNQLTNFTIPPGLVKLSLIVLSRNQLDSLVLAPGLISLAFLEVTSNRLTNITLPPDVQELIGIFAADNPVATFVLSEPLAVTGMASVVASYRNQGVSIFSYPLAVHLVPFAAIEETFEIGIAGPSGVYSVLGSTNLTGWSSIGIASNAFGSVTFHQENDNLSPRTFYRALLHERPQNMAFVSPNTFTMGSPANEQDRNVFEGPQATVTLTRGYWIGKYEVTQREYLAVTGENPSDFPGDLNRPVSSVTWADATNYCSRLTEQEFTAGRIPMGSRYRLPTEAEWECATRAGTTTRFSFGDDPSYTGVTNHAWFINFSDLDLTVHPVGQKLPNSWGLYDTAGNVWEWCQDAYGDQIGGVQIDPQGPASNAQGLKVIRGGAYDYPNSDCRSASRFFRFGDWPDSDVGFRVVLSND